MSRLITIISVSTFLGDWSPDEDATIPTRLNELKRVKSATEIRISDHDEVCVLDSCDRTPAPCTPSVPVVSAVPATPKAEKPKETKKTDKPKEEAKEKTAAANPKDRAVSVSEEEAARYRKDVRAIFVELNTKVRKDSGNKESYAGLISYVHSIGVDTGRLDDVPAEQLPGVLQFITGDRDRIMSDTGAAADVDC